MTDPLPSPPPVGAPITYRPLSGFAIAGFALACVFALLVLIAAGVALAQGMPFFYTPWVLLVPAAALILAVMARSQIRSAEGTRAGETLARAALWISVLTGLGYIAYYGVTALAVTTQANAFLTEIGPDSGFFPHLQKAAASRTDFNAAFLLAVAPSQRPSAVRPEDELAVQRAFNRIGSDGAPGPLSMFRKQFLVRIITTAPPGEVKIEPLGVQSWEYEKRGYRVQRNYRLTTPEAVIECIVPVHSSEGETVGEARKWYVEVNAMPKPAVRRTDFGHGLAALRHHAAAALGQWIAELNGGQSFAFAEVDRTAWDQLLPEPDKRGYVHARIEDLFKSKEPGRFAELKLPLEEDLGGWKIDEGRIRLEYTFRLALGPQGSQPMYGIEGLITVASKEVVDPLALSAVQNAAELRQIANPEWAVQGIAIQQVSPMGAKMGPPRKG